MKIYVVERYSKGGLGEDDLITDYFEDIEHYIADTLFSEDSEMSFDVVGYEIPDEDARKFNYNVSYIYTNCIANFDYFDDIGNQIIFGRRYDISNC